MSKPVFIVRLPNGTEPKVVREIEADVDKRLLYGWQVMAITGDLYYGVVRLKPFGSTLEKRTIDEIENEITQKLRPS